MSILDTIKVEDFKKQFPRFSPQYLSDITYTEGTEYFKGTVVFYDNSFYICKVEKTTASPLQTSDWESYNSSILNYTQDSDIENAFLEASVNFNEKLFPDEKFIKMVFLYLTAHYLTIDFNNAIGKNNIGILTSKSVGSVSEGYTIPNWLANSSALSVYASTGYGIKYASLIRPYLIGNVMLFKGATTIA